MHNFPGRTPAKGLPVRHHAGSCVTGQQLPWPELRRGFPASTLIDGEVEFVEAGGPLDAPRYIPRGGAEAFQSNFLPRDGTTIFFTEMREGV